MTSSIPPNNQIFQRRSLPAASASSPNGDLATNVTDQQGQQIANGISTYPFHNNSNQVSVTRRQLRSSGPPQKISLDWLDLDILTPEEQHTLIVNIIGGGAKEELSNYDISTDAKLHSIHRTLSIITHPDRHTEDTWIARASQAQQRKS